jgi:two-component system response regulator YesN
VYSIQLAIEDKGERANLESWICHEFAQECVIDKQSKEVGASHILIMEIRTLLDWIKLNRIRRKNKECRIFPILNPNILHTSPLAIELKLPSLFVKPVKKSLFIRNIKRVIETLSDEHVSSLDYGQIYEQIKSEQETNREDAPFQEAFLRRLLRGEVTTEQEVIHARAFLPGEAVPNIVCFIQGFVRFPEQEEREGWQAPTVIQESFRRQFSLYIPHLFFLPYRKHMVMLFRVPAAYASLRYWKKGQEVMLQVIQELEDKYGIHLYIGVGSVYREPLLLHQSYREARKARRTPPYERLSLRYYEEIATDAHMRKCTDYIAEHYTEDLSMKQMAIQMNLSAPYFSRLFKKETGRSFVEYVTFVRLQRAVWLLRHTNQTIEQIAEDLGFNTPNYFSGTFKKYAGLTPSEYRATKEILFL